MVRLREALDGGLKRLGVLRKARRARAVDVWAEAVGPTAAKASRATRCKDGVLFVAVSTSVWACELSLLKPDIIRKLNRLLGKGTITDVRFQVRGSLRTGQRNGGAGSSPGSDRYGTAAHPSVRRPLSRAEMDEIQALSASISDSLVREAFTRAASAARMGSRERCEEARLGQTEPPEADEGTRS